MSMYLLHQHHLRHALDPCLDPLVLPNLAQPRPHMHVRGRDKKKSSPEAQESAEEDAALVAPAPATNMPKTSSSQSTVAMLSQGRGVGEGAFQRALGAHGSAAGFLAAWLRHPRKNRSRSSATPARLSLLGGQLRMLMRRGNVSIVAMHKRSMLTCHDQQAGSPRLQTGMLTSSHWLPRQRRRGHLAVLAAPQCRKRRAARGTRRPGSLSRAASCLQRRRLAFERGIARHGAFPHRYHLHGARGSQHAVSKRGARQKARGAWHARAHQAWGKVVDPINLHRHSVYD